MEITRENILVTTFDTATEVAEQSVEGVLKRELFLCDNLYREGSSLLKHEVERNLYFCFQQKEGVAPTSCSAISSINRNLRGVVRNSTQIILDEPNMEDFFLRGVYISRHYFSTRLNGRISDTFSKNVERFLNGGNPLAVMSLL